MDNQAESFSNSNRTHLLSNYSTGQLIPACRSEALKAKRQALRRKLNRVADQIYNLKYDTEYQVIELKRLNKMGEDFFETVENMKEKAKKEIEATKVFEEECLDLNLNKINGSKSESTDRSTERSIMVLRNGEDHQEEVQGVSKFDQECSQKETIRLTQSGVAKSYKQLSKIERRKLFFQQQHGPTQNMQHFWNFCLFLLGCYIIVLII